MHLVQVLVVRCLCGMMLVSCRWAVRVEIGMENLSVPIRLCLLMVELLVGMVPAKVGQPVARQGSGRPGAGRRRTCLAFTSRTSRPGITRPSSTWWRVAAR